jgi:transcription initiation factor IIE alpha subunit
MVGNEQREYVFLCPECNESMRLDNSMRKALIERGCVVCGASVTADAFSRDSSPDAT